MVARDDQEYGSFCIGKSGVNFRDIACPCCGDVNLNSDLWGKLDTALSKFKPYEYFFEIGYLCWNEARKRYAESQKAESKRIRLSGLYEHIYRGNAMVISCDKEDVERIKAAVLEADLIFTEIVLNGIPAYVVSTEPFDFRRRCEQQKSARTDLTTV